MCFFIGYWKFEIGYVLLSFMKKNAIIMGMPATINIVDKEAKEKDIQKVFSYFQSIDQTFSTYKNTSEIAKINSGELQAHKWSTEMKHIFALSEETKTETDGYFDI